MDVEAALGDFLGIAFKKNKKTKQQQLEQQHPGAFLYDCSVVGFTAAEAVILHPNPSASARQGGKKKKRERENIGPHLLWRANGDKLQQNCVSPAIFFFGRDLYAPANDAGIDSSAVKCRERVLKCPGLLINLL